MILCKGETLDDLEYKGLKIIQRKGFYHFTSDSVILANQVKANSKETVLDMGTGSGIIAILVAAKTRAKQIIAIDIQDVMVDMATRSVALNGLEDRIKVCTLDIKEAPLKLGLEKYDIVVVNPPYGKINTVEYNKDEHINISKNEVDITLQDIILSASKLLKYGGKFYIIIKAVRQAEIIKLLYDNRLTPKKITNILPKANKLADTVIIEAKKCAKDGVLIDTLVVYNEDNTMTKRAKKLYSNKI